MKISFKMDFLDEEEEDFLASYTGEKIVNRTATETNPEIIILEIKLPTITQTTAEILKNEAYSRKMTDDFLMDFSEYEVPNIETTMELLEEPTYSEPKYYGKELLNLITTNSTMKDIS